MFGLTPYNRRNNEAARRNDIWDLRSVFNDFFNDSLFPTAFGTAHPIKADIRETDKEYILDAEIPGVSKEDIKLDLRDNTLTISVEHNEQSSEERDNYIRKERRYGSFSRSFYVENVKHEDVSAKYNNGILTVILPKIEGGKNNARKIDIQQ
ncbi:MAG: Hsp20/alpha crystallin family protein [Clostridia bacterium]|nr:Hsp20/alpha crystallin family protein [Clostridia bacterium]